ncbi:hypothetical protein F5B19DRAFT_476627 [Rostrohypoxylon terebratum]|nr:hypothetical protein F5B19DRAFT_476627 [Rostrohypoxylon terebratum]
MAEPVETESAKTAIVKQTPSFFSRYLSGLVDLAKKMVFLISVSFALACLLSLGGYVKESVLKIIEEFVLYLLPLFLYLPIISMVLFSWENSSGATPIDADK